MRRGRPNERAGGWHALTDNATASRAIRWVAQWEAMRQEAYVLVPRGSALLQQKSHGDHVAWRPYHDIAVLTDPSSSYVAITATTHGGGAWLRSISGIRHHDDMEMGRVRVPAAEPTASR